MISVIIPFYNAEPHIERCLQSVIAQTYSDFEIILINDCSTDKSLLIVENFLSKNSNIKYSIFSHPKNLGLSASRNTGMRISTYEYLFFIDADDELASPNSLETFAQHIPGNYDFITADCQYKYLDGRRKKSILSQELSKNTEFNENDVFEAFLERKISVVAWNKLYCKKFLQEHKLTFKEGLLYEDEVWTFEVCYFARKVFAINKITYDYFQDNTESITNKFSEKNVKSFSVIIENLVDFCKKNEVLKKYDKEKVANYFKIMCELILEKEPVSKNRKLWAKLYESFKNSIYSYNELGEMDYTFNKNPTKTSILKFYYKKYPSLFNSFLFLKAKIKL